MIRSLLLYSSVLIASVCVLPAAIVSQTFTGKTAFFNPVTELDANFPIGTVWEVKVEWDDTAVGEVYTENQAGYPLTKLTLTLKGKSGDWTSSSLPGKASFSLNRFGSHEIQFTSGWGPENHTNGTIPGGATYSINLVLSDPTITALPDITTVPGPIDLSKWTPDPNKSHLKFYITELGRAIYGSIDGLGEVTIPEQPEISVQQPKDRELKDGTSVIRYDAVKKGKTGETKSFVIHNAGTDTLKRIQVSMGGRHQKDFSIAKFSKKSLEPGEKATVKVTFKPTAKGKRKAVLIVESNDKDEKSFEIELLGTGK